VDTPEIATSLYRIASRKNLTERQMPRVKKSKFGALEMAKDRDGRLDMVCRRRAAPRKKKPGSRRDPLGGAGGPGQLRLRRG
jgi:hypothetical protein